MKKYFVVAIAVLALVAVAMPASAKVEFSYGGLFRARVISQSDFARDPAFVDRTRPNDGVIDVVRDRDEDTLNRLDQRTRLFFTFTASENLKLVTKFEFNEVWGDSTTGGKIGADHPNDFIVKNSYIDFNIPNAALPLNAKVGIQGINLINSWVVDDDFSSANITAKFDNVKLTLGYIAGQNNDAFAEKENVDDWFAVIDYVCGPWSASLVGFYQFGHDTFASADPSTHQGGVPVGGVLGNRLPGPIAPGAIPLDQAVNPGNRSFQDQMARNFFQRYFDVFSLETGNRAHHARALDNNLFDLAFNLNYKIDWLSAYVNFVKNFGSIEVIVFDNANEVVPGESTTAFHRDMDYTGWMIDAGVNYFCGPFTLNVGGFYTTGPEDIAASLGNGDGDNGGKHTGEIDWFTYPMQTTKYFSEILGGGILDNRAPQHEDFQWRGYPAPSNLWTVNLGAAWQLLPSTKAAFSYWYFGTSEDVVSGPKRVGDNGDFQHQNDFLTQFFGNGVDRRQVEFASDIGHEFNLNITHKIVDGLVLDLVAAYLIAGDAYSMRADDLDAMELGARLQWSF